MADTTAEQPGAEPKASMRTVVAASSAGTAFEWYDFFVFGALTSIIGKNFGSALLLTILTILTIILGVVALCIGLLVAWPVVTLAHAYSYRRFNGQPVAA